MHLLDVRDVERDGGDTVAVRLETAAECVARSRSTSAIVTRSPRSASASTMARPIPRAPPVTSAARSGAPASLI